MLVTLPRMAWFMTPFGPQSVIEPANIHEFRRRDYLELTDQQAADYFAGVVEIPDVSFVTGQELPGAMAAAAADTSSAFSVAQRAASVAAVEAADTVNPTGVWDFDTAPTVNGAALGTGGGATVSDASTTVKGVVELATTAETTAGSDSTRAVTPAAAKIAYAAALPTVGSYTYNPDGTIATDPEGNAYTWNTDGTPATQTRNGVTRTFSWNTDLTLASVS